MSWSYRITILYLGFVGIIVTLVTISSRNKEELVSKDYYAQELKYQEKIDATNNANALPESITHNLDEKNIALAIPLNFLVKNFKGEIYFFCPSNSAKDKIIKMGFDSEGKQMILKNNLQHGIYKMKLSWSSAGKNYFKEDIININ